MSTFEITVKIDNSYEIVERVTAKDISKALTEVRQSIKKKLKPEQIWFIEIKHI